MDFKIYMGEAGWMAYSSFLTTDQTILVKGVELFHKRLGFCSLVAIGKQNSILVKPVCGRPLWVMKNAVGVKRVEFGLIP